MTSWSNRTSQIKAHGPNYMSVKFRCQNITRLGLVAVSIRLSLTTLQPKSRKKPRIRGGELWMVPLSSNFKTDWFISFRSHKVSDWSKGQFWILIGRSNSSHWSSITDTSKIHFYYLRGKVSPPTSGVLQWVIDWVCHVVSVILKFLPNRWFQWLSIKV